MDLAALRAEIPALREAYPLNAGGVAPMPRATLAAIAEAYEQEGATVGIGSVRGKQAYTDRMDALRDDLARMFGAQPHEIALSRAVSESISLVAEGLDLQRGDRVILSDEEHPSGYLSWLNLRNRRDIDIRWVRADAGADAFLAEMEDLADERTRAICLSHVTTERGLVLPIKRASALARERGAVTIVDGAQAAGQVPVDVHDLGCDFYAFPAFKWCMGPYGVGAMYVREAMLEAMPVAGAGAGSATIFSFPPGKIGLQPSAARFEFGARPYPLYVGWRRSLEVLTSFGDMAAVQARNQQLWHQVRAELEALDGVEVFTPDQGSRANGILTFGLAGSTGSSVADFLVDECRVHCRRAHHDRGVRVCLHWFVDGREIDALLEGLRAFRSR